MFSVQFNSSLIIDKSISATPLLERLKWPPLRQSKKQKIFKIKPYSLNAHAYGEICLKINVDHDTEI